ncbi:general secretion pathway protein GspK [Duganella sp. Leaf126]|uniref:type II secretion system minor pseudopilin GspK n=1 Tax=Duganella sp. Leaf126 TaxID=1736266 RepID=UPI0006FE668C|nr:type II secretion system minor pseudopilin GspK [Duganella sp. Leaf126]KQQ32632.1 general secretion pathway protein GspK [Duganella sp. Leaf126]
MGNHRSSPRRQRGVAVVTALLLTTLAVTIVASLFWQQQVQVRSMENQRLQFQTRWIVRGALSFSKFILFSNFYSRRNQVIETDPWAQPLEESRIDDYIEREQRESENFNATLSGRIVDAQSRYNLTNLSNGRTISPVDVAMFERLLTILQLNPTLALPLARQIASTQPLPKLASGDGAGGTGATNSNAGTTSGAGTGMNGAAAGSAGGGAGAGTPAQQATGGNGEPMGLVRVDDLLAVSGFTPQAVERLRDFLIILPQRTPLNVNTAPAELLAALSPNLPLADATVMVNARKRGGFYLDVAGYASQPQITAANRVPPAELYAVTSNYFLVYSRVRLDRAALDAVSLLQRDSNSGQSTVLWIRENENGDQRKREF